jgi:YD repeat-containing protein
MSKWKLFYYAVDNSSGITSNTVYFTVFTANPQVSVSPSSGTNGTTFQQPGSGFTPNGTATLHFNTPDGPTTVSNKPINSSGSYTHSWTCEGCPNGSYSYYAVDNSSGITSNTVYFTVFTANPQVSVSPSSGTNGTTFQQPGSGFTPNGTATLHFNTPDGPTTVSNKPINSSGSYTHSWTCEGCPNGSYSYYAVDNSSGITSNTVYFTVFTANPQVSVSPSSGTNGTTFQQPGSGFTPNGTATLHFNTPDGPSTVSNKPINSSGSYTHSWTCEGCTAGTYNYYAIDNITGLSSNIIEFYVTYQQLTLNYPINATSVTTNEITFQWEAVPNATYQLYVDNNEGLGSPEIAPQHITDLQTLTENSFTISANWLTPDYTYYWKVFAITPDGTYESVVDSFIYSPPKQPEPTWVPLYRAFNSEFVDHFYCSAENHLAQAMDNNYTFEGTEGYVALHPFELSSPDTLKPIYRFYVPADGNPKRSCHYYTISGSDRDNRIIEDWIYEGIIGYGFNNPKEGLTKLYRTWLDVPNDRMDYFYTTSEIQKNNSISMFGYSDQGFVGYVSMHGDNSTMTWLPSNPAIGRGINPVNGNLGHYQSNIFTIDEGLVALQYGHLYNSDAVRLFSAQQPLGNGWSHSYNAALHVTDNVVFVNWPDHAHIYNKVTLKSITPGNYDLLTKVNNNLYQIKKKNQTIYTFEKLSVSNTENTYWLTSITDRHGNTITLSYNNKGWLKWVRSPANRFISFTYYTDYEKHGLVRYVKDSLALNRTVEYLYNSSRNLVGFVDAMNQTTQFEYNATQPYDHFLETIVFSDGSKIRNTYDSETRRIVEQEHYSDQKSNYKTFLSLPVNNQVNVTDAVGTVTGFKFDVTGNLTELITANSNVWLQFDDPAHPTKPTRILQGMGNFTEIVYNAAGDPLQISRTNGGIHKYQWNSTNDLTKYTNPLNKETNLTYQNGKLTAIQNPRATYHMTYASSGNLLTIVNPLSHTTAFSYNASNNLTAIADNLGNTTGFQYDAAGRMTHSTDANNNTTVSTTTITICL